MATEQTLVDEILRLSQGSLTQAKSLEETIALGLLVSVKWDRARSKVSPSASLQTLLSNETFTPAELSTLRSLGARMLKDQKDRWSWKRDIGFGTLSGVAAALIWSLIVFFLGLWAIHSHGGDLGGVIQGLVNQQKPSG